MIDEKLRNRLQYISKSKMGTFLGCPMSFKFCYIDKIEQGYNPYFVLGNNVHDFIDTFFDIISTLPDGNIKDLTKLTFHPNTQYKKNVAKFEIERWMEICKAGFDESFFMPVVKEKRWTTEDPKLIGIVDRVHKCHKNDVFAPKHPEFKDGDLVITENKTGKPTPEKCKNYESDMLWYKIIMEIVQPELIPIKWGAIYFPYNNYVYHCELKKEDTEKLMKRINEVRRRINICLDTGLWSATPSQNACFWCSYKNHCDVAVR